MTPGTLLLAPDTALAEIIILIVQTWVVIGGVSAVAFLLFGIDRVDPAAKGSYAFRPLLIPGIVVIWPLVLWRWWTLEQFNKHGCPARKDTSDTSDTGDVSS